MPAGAADQPDRTPPGARAAGSRKYRRAPSWPSLAALISASLLSACGLIEQHYELRYRLTFEVETPQGLRTGSGVVQVTTDLNPVWAPGPQTDAHLSGEAIPIDLPNGQTLFAVSYGPGGHPMLFLPGEVFGRLVNTPNFEEGGRTFYNLERQVDFLMSTKPTAELTEDQLPLLVRFRDVARPMSVEAVDPEDMPQVFGPGYRLRRVTMQVTDEPVSRGIERRLPWLKKLKPGTFNGREVPTTHELTDNIGPLTFKSLD
jgi:hypothetical protein